MNEPSQPTIAFDEFEIDTFHRRLLRRGEPVVLTAKAFDVLAFLVENNGKVVGKEEILDSVWGDRFVEESNLVVQISNLRRVLGESPNAPRFLATIPGKGYKFAAETGHNGYIVETHTVAELTIEEREVSERPRFNRQKVLVLTACVIVSIAIVGFAASIWQRSSGPAPTRPLKFSKVTTSGRVSSATISPDGKFAVFAQKDEIGESLWLRQLETGSEARIVEAKPVEYIGLTMSPDGQYIYASVFAKNEIDPSIQKISMLGGVAQQIPNVSTGSSISIAPDGKRFAFTSSNSGENETMFGVANIDGSDSKILIRAKHESRYITMFQSSPVAWAPNGSEIALAVQEKQGETSFSTILSVDPNDGSERPLTTQRWKGIEDLVWLDADRLAFIATEENGPSDQIWIFSRQAAVAKQVTNDLRSHSWLGAANGKLLTVQLTNSSSLRVAEIDAAKTAVTIQEIFTASDYIDELDWDDKGGIIFASNAGGTGELWQMNADGSGQKQLSTGAIVGFGVSTSTDGSIVFSSRREGKRGIWTADREGGSLKMLTDGRDQAPDISDDGKVVFHRGIGYAEGVFLVSAVEPDPRRLREKCYFPAISRDGRIAACYFMDLKAARKWRIALIATDTGSTVNELDLPVPIFERQIRFHPDGQHITQIFSQGQSLSLLMLPIDGSKPAIIQGLGKGTSHVPSWETNGTRFLYPVITESQDVVMLTDL